MGEEKLDEDALRAVAESSGGSYFFAADRQQLATIYDELDQIETREVNVISHRPCSDVFFWPLLAALLVSFSGKGLESLAQSRSDVSAMPAKRVRVDPVTGELEVSA